MSAAKNMTPCPAALFSPCPCCGAAEIEVQAVSVGMRDGYACACTACLTQGPVAPTSERAAACWNRLAALRDAVERVGLSQTLVARFVLGPSSAELLDRGVPLAAQPLTLVPTVEQLRSVLGAVDHCADIARKALDR